MRLAAMPAVRTILPAVQPAWALAQALIPVAPPPCRCASLALWVVLVLEMSQAGLPNV